SSPRPRLTLFSLPLLCYPSLTSPSPALLLASPRPALLSSPASSSFTFASRVVLRRLHYPAFTLTSSPFARAPPFPSPRTTLRLLPYVCAPPPLLSLSVSPRLPYPALALDRCRRHWRSSSSGKVVVGGDEAGGGEEGAVVV
ncbi:hypothetical protein CPC08DRAFT_783683, partial [Agrocybe pediades]